MIYHVIRATKGVQASLIVRAKVSHGHVAEATSSNTELETVVQQLLRNMLRGWTESLLTVSAYPCALFKALLALLRFFSFVELVASSQNC